MRFTLKSALLTFNFTEGSTGAIRESSETRKRLLLPSTSKVISDWSETTIGRTVKLWGLTGVMTKFPERGKINGPPQLNEYPVEPVGVEIIMPSAQYEFRNSPSM